MSRERVGKVFIHECGNIWCTRFEKPKRCPKCFRKLDKWNCKKINLKQAKTIFNGLLNKVSIAL
jgi:hypothetical protein